MSDFVLALLDLCLIPFKATDNLIVFVPIVCLVVAMLFALVSRLIRGRYT